TSRPGGTERSSVEFFLPAKRSAFAARVIASAADPSAFLVAAPKFKLSSQNTRRTPLVGVANGLKPSLRASVIDRWSFSWQLGSAGLPAPIWRAPKRSAKPQLTGIQPIFRRWMMRSASTHCDYGGNRAAQARV